MNNYFIRVNNNNFESSSNFSFIHVWASPSLCGTDGKPQGDFDAARNIDFSSTGMLSPNLDYARHIVQVITTTSPRHSIVVTTMHTLHIGRFRVNFFTNLCTLRSTVFIIPQIQTLGPSCLIMTSVSLHHYQVLSLLACRLIGSLPTSN